MGPLNKLAEPNPYPMLTPNEINQRMRNKKKISIMDALTFNQWRLHPDDWNRVSITTH